MYSVPGNSYARHSHPVTFAKEQRASPFEWPSTAQTSSYPEAPVKDFIAVVLHAYICTSCDEFLLYGTIG